MKKVIKVSLLVLVFLAYVTLVWCATYVDAVNARKHQGDPNSGSNCYWNTGNLITPLGPPMNPGIQPFTR